MGKKNSAAQALAALILHPHTCVSVQYTGCRQEGRRGEHHFLPDLQDDTGYFPDGTEINLRQSCLLPPKVLFPPWKHGVKLVPWPARAGMLCPRLLPALDARPRGIS